MIRQIITLLYDLFLALMICSVLISWVPGMRWSAFGRLIYGLSEPLLQPVRRIIPPLRRGNASLDFSVFVLMLVVGVLYTILMRMF